MEITIKKERERTTEKVQFNGSRVDEFLKELAINKEAVLVVRNSEVLTSDEELQDKDVIEILSVVSGG
jgi:sulfur carrier protein